MTEKNETSTTQEAGQKKDNKTQAQRKVGTNPLKLPWPTDPQGQVSSLKKGGVEAAKRVNGDPDRLKKLVETLRIIEAHAKERFVKDKAARQVSKENAVSARARVAEKQRRQAEAKAAEFEAAAKGIRSKAGIKAEPEQEG